MADLTWTTVTAFNASMSAIDADMQDAILTYVNTTLNDSLFTDESLLLARVYLALHFAQSTTDGSTGASGPVSSKSAGGISKSYGSGSFSTDSGSLASTRYGQLYLDLIRPAAAGPIVP